MSDTSASSSSSAAAQAEPVQARIDWAAFEAHAGGVVSALRDYSRAVDASGLDKGLVELLKLRASQINGCAFCLQFHLNLARKLGLPQRQLDQLAAWRDSHAFSARERAALAWTEALTRMAAAPVEGTLYADLQAQFSEGEIANLTAAIAAINAWNRIAGALRFTPPGG
ncbi:carboxymuconolactone decarboxylase family protein [Kinneretia aquatilis]|jgi:AhpD family alkylhydroperoxidase|uniref:carboxymuconolactone decarboxylase family protein n=1 Tax=Kinneretia aquatilis TaxID=2070761 RepID=UPI001495182E|nr:carboxymuconolactone decarboxylase family protein [Paucibacter aquatile]WIV99646.1 carboxymuconolactone decarboxylase family protein [Paucibacter aquatile]